MQEAAFVAWSELAAWLEGYGLGLAGWFAEAQLEGVLFCAILTLFSMAVASCGGITDDSSDAPPANIALALSPTQIQLPRGGTRTVTVSVTRENYNGPLSLEVSGPPSGVTATFNPSTVTGATSSSTLTLAASVDAVTFNGPVLIATRSVVAADSVGAFAELLLSVFSPAVTVTRAGTGSGTVISTPAGINCGNTCAASFAATSVTLTATPAAGSAFAGWSGACTGTTPTCTLTPGGGTSNSVTATFNTTAPGFSLAVAPALLTVAQGAAGTATVSATRVNGFSGAVNLTVSGAPAGLTVAANPATVTGASGMLDIAAALSVPAGNYPITITGTGSGVAQQTATFNVQVTPAAGGSSSIAFSYATCDPAQVPIWFAVQNGSGPWSRVNVGANNTFVVPVSAKVGIASVVRDGTAYSTTVSYASGSDFTSVALGNPCASTPQTGTKRVSGTLSNVAMPPVFATVSIGGADTTVVSPGGQFPFTLTDVPSGTRDLIAGVHSFNSANGQTPLMRVIIRRDVAYANGANIPNLDFGLNSGQYFVPAPAFATIENTGADQLSISESFSTANGASAPIHAEEYAMQTTSPPRVRYFPVPDSLLLPSDLHTIQVFAEGSASSFRFATMLLHRATDQTITFGPPLATPVVTTPTSTPYLRPRAQIPFQSQYDAAAFADFSQNQNSVEVSASAGYFGGAPANWTLDVPDLTSAGYDAAWGLRSGTPVDWEVGALTGSYLVFSGATAVDGTRIIGAGTSSSASALRQTRPAAP
jgi:hypothetical protein